MVLFSDIFDGILLDLIHGQMLWDRLPEECQWEPWWLETEKHAHLPHDARQFFKRSGSSHHVFLQQVRSQRETIEGEPLVIHWRHRPSFVGYVWYVFNTFLRSNSSWTRRDWTGFLDTRSRTQDPRSETSDPSEPGSWILDSWILFRFTDSLFFVLRI